MPAETRSRDSLCAALEREYVHDVYNKTAHHFVDVRYKAWPCVKQFLLDLPPGALVADVGCGSGKYLSINKDIVTVGCDHSSGLLQVARQQNHQVLSCDNLKLPFRDGSFDAVISIGVIHHFTTPSRRARAIQELSRVLTPGGTAIICVWAMEQKHRKFKAQDVLVPWHLRVRHNKSGQKKEETRKGEQPRDEFPSPADLGISGHVSRPPQYTYRGSIDSSPPISGSCRSREPSLRNSYIKSKVQKEHSSQGPESGTNTFRYMLKNHFRIQRKKGSSPVMSEATAVFPMSATVVANVDPQVISSQQLKQDVSHDEIDRKDLTAQKLWFPSLIKSKLRKLIGGGRDKSPVREVSCPAQQLSQKDLKYKQLLDEIVREDSKLFEGCHGDGLVPSFYALEGFAVREFPASSRCTSVNNEPASETSENDKKSGSLTGQDLGNSFETGLRTNTDPDYKQKCVTWLEQTSQYKANRPENLPLTGEYIAGANHTDNTGNALTSNGDVFCSPDWERVTSQLIRSLETQMDGAATGAMHQGTRLTSNCSQLNGVTDKSQCTCGSRQNATPSGGESGTHDRPGAAMATGRLRHRSDSSLSSVSSMSSDSNSLRSDIEEMTVCAVCRGDSVEFGITVDNTSSPSSSSSSDNKKAPDACRDSNETTAACSPKKVSHKHCGSSTAVKSDSHPAQIKTQPTSLRTSHDSGYSEPDRISHQDRSVPENAALHTAHTVSQPPQDMSHSQPVSSHTEPATTDCQPDADSYKRFYHVFREGELLSLIEKRVKSLKVVDSFYDHANWCVIVQKV